MGDSRENRENDDALVSAARAGDERAFEGLLVRHEGRVLRVLRLLGVNGADREDVAQDVFVRVFRHLSGFRPGQSFRAWTYRITVNAAHDYRRKTMRRRREEVWEADGDQRADRAPGPAELAERAQDLRDLDAAMTLLTERERAVFALCEIEGLDTAQVARALRISRITVRRHLSLARARLREALEAEKSPRS